MNVQETATIIYSVTLIICAMLFFATSIMKVGNLQQGVLKILVFDCMMVIGYLVKATADAPSQLITSQKLLFVGGCFSNVYLFKFYVDFCHVKMPKAVNLIISAFAVVVSCFAATFDKHHIVYSAYEVTQNNGVYTLVTQQGVMSYAYALFVLAIDFGLLTMTIVKMRKGSSHRRAMAVLLGISTLIPIICYPVDYVVIPDFDMTPVGITISASLLFILVMALKVYDTEDIVRREVLTRMNAATILLTADNCFQGCNPLAMKLFPELKEIGIMDVVDEKKYEQIIKMSKGLVPELTIDGKFYECEVFMITDHGKTKGKAIWVSDATSFHEYVDLLENYEDELEHKVDEKTRHIVEIQNKVVRDMADIIENRDGNTGGHVKRTNEVVSILANDMLKDSYPGVTPQFCEIIKRTAAMHDLGKISIEDRILRKNGKLTDEEFAEMKSHTEKGSKIVETVLEGVENEQVVSITKAIALSHHEKWNGTGYPQGLAGEEIPLAARIMAIADVYDALVSRRCYKEPMSFEQAHTIMKESFGTHFDPSLEKYFENSLGEIESYYAKDREG